MSIYIICHERLPDYTPPPEAKIMWLNAKPIGDPRGFEVIPGYDLFENPEQMHQTYSGALGAMAILKVLPDEPITPHVTIWQYRKFVSRTAYGRQSPNLGSTRLVKPAELVGVTLENPEVGLEEGAFLVHQPTDWTNVFANYHRHHHVLDFIRFAGLLVENDVLLDKDILKFFWVRFMIVGGAELGVYPRAWWIDAHTKMNRAALAFSERYGPCDPVDPYQRRAVAFLQERLGSFLAIKRLSEMVADVLIYPHGHVHTVTDADRFIAGS